MKLRQPVKLSEQVRYPTTDEAIAYAEDFRLHHQQGYDDTTTSKEYYHNPEVDAYVRGCGNHYYHVYGWTVVGFEIACLDEVELKEGWIGWLLQYLPLEHRWKVIADTRTNGIAGFKEVKHSFCPPPVRTGKRWLPIDEYTKDN